MGYSIVHEYRCDGCNRVVHLPQAVNDYGHIEATFMPGFKHYGDYVLCPDCAEKVTPKLEELMENIRK